MNAASSSANCRAGWTTTRWLEVGRGESDKVERGLRSALV